MTVGRGFWTRGILVAVMLCIVSTAGAQVTNLNFDNVGTTFTMTSGDTIRWEYNLPAGSTALCEIWLDVNNNHVIDPATDVNMFTFTQTDGDTSGNGGPPDLDGTVNGHIIFYQRIGLPAGHYILRFTENSIGMSGFGTVQALPSPAHTISGTVTPPAGKSPKNALLQMERKSYEPVFWCALTDSLGNYAIEMNSDTAGNPWRLRVQNNPFPGAVVSPSEINVTVIGNPGNNNFVFTAPAAQVAGEIITDNGTAMPGAQAVVMRADYNVQNQAQADVFGKFDIGLLAGDLNGQTWRLQSVCNCPNGLTGSELIAQVNLPVINNGDSLYRVLTVYTANSQISGHVRINGVPATGYTINVIASSTDTAMASAMTDTATGNFTIGVSNKISSYDMFVSNLPPNYTQSSVSAHAGDTGVVLNITVTSVIDRQFGRPASYSLHQNYPNPFNPSTTIQYDLPVRSNVVLKVFNVYGQEVGTLISGIREAGTASVVWDGNGFASGVYFYRLQASSVDGRATSFTQTRKLLLIK